jgi:hypothetical protein
MLYILIDRNLLLKTSQSPRQYVFSIAGATVFTDILCGKASTASAVSSTAVSKESEEEVGGVATPTTTPKLGRRGRGGSFSSPGQNYMKITIPCKTGVKQAKTSDLKHSS